MGAGEGAFDRFEKEQGLELHSAIVTILFSYGIVGFGLFAVFLLQVIKKKPIYLILMLAPVFMVGLTGQTFRFSHFWLLMALTYVSYRPPFVVHHKEKQQTPYFGFSKTMT